MDPPPKKMSRKISRISLPSAGLWRSWGSGSAAGAGCVGQRDLGVGGDHLRHLAHGQRHRRVVVAGAQIGNHLPPDVAHLGVVQDSFQAVSHVDAVLVVAHGQQHQHALVRALLADLPLVFKLVGVVGRVVPVQGLNGHHGNLRIGLGVVQLRRRCESSCAIASGESTCA